MDILKISGLTKSFGSQVVLNNFQMQVPEHSVFGFVGPNGAGKTTTMKLILGLLRPDEGNITVCNEKVKYGETKTNRYIGFLPDVPEFYNYMKPREYLRLCGQITGLEKREIKEKSAELLELVGLSKVNKRIGGFSRGMKQRLGIAQALINEPRLLICDEPTSALDPLGRKEILDLLSIVRKKTTVLFSTHILSDVERICDQVLVINKGQAVLAGTLSEIRAHHRHNTYLLEFATIKEAEKFTTREELKNKNILVIKKEKTVTIKLKEKTVDGVFLLKVLSQMGIVPLKFLQVEPSLEDLFEEVIK